MHISILVLIDRLNVQRSTDAKDNQLADEWHEKNPILRNILAIKNSVKSDHRAGSDVEAVAPS